MKKLLIAAGAVVVIAAGVVIVRNKSGDIAETELNKLISQYTNQPLVIDYLQSSPMISKATWQITQAGENNISSVAHVKFTALDDEFVVPINSEIIRGKTEYDGKSYGFGKIVSRPDLSNYRDNLAEQFTNESLTSTLYIALDGDVTEVSNIAAFQTDDGDLDFKGLTTSVSTSLLDLSNYDGKISVEPFVFSDGGESSLEFSKINISFAVDEDGNYQGKSQPHSISVQGFSPIVIDFSEGDYKGSYRRVDDLVVPLSNGELDYAKISVSVAGTPIVFKQVKFSGGTYDAGDKLVNLGAGVSMDIDVSELQNNPQSPISPNITPQHFEIQYYFKQLPYQVINTYYETISNVYDNPTDIDKEAIVQSALTDVQQADSFFELSSSLTAAEGNASIDSKFGLSEAGKNITPQDFITMADESEEMLLTLIMGETKAVIDEMLADKSETAPLMQLMLGATPQDGKYTLNFELKDGVPILNGTPLR